MVAIACVFLVGVPEVTAAFLAFAVAEFAAVVTVARVLLVSVPQFLEAFCAMAVTEFTAVVAIARVLLIVVPEFLITLDAVSHNKSPVFFNHNGHNRMHNGHYKKTHHCHCVHRKNHCAYCGKKSQKNSC